MKVRRLFPVAAVVTGGWLAWGLYWGDFRGPVTDSEARGHFERIVAAARAKDFDALCRLNSSVRTCRAELQVYCRDNNGPIPGPMFAAGEELERMCREAVPPDPPLIVSSRDQPKVGDSTAGRILTVRGVDGRGRSYETEVMVFWTGRGFLATHAVFWSGDKFDELREASR